jgi:hypothetical protein
MIKLVCALDSFFIVVILIEQGYAYIELFWRIGKFNYIKVFNYLVRTSATKAIACAILHLGYVDLSFAQMQLLPLERASRGLALAKFSLKGT